MSLESIEKLRKSADEISECATPCGASPDWMGVRRKVGELADAIEQEIAERYVKLPLDANGEYIHVGDEVDFLGHSTVDAIGKDGEVFIFASNWLDGVFVQRACELRHYHKPTLEDVLSECCSKYHNLLIESMSDSPHNLPSPSEIIDEYAEKVREVVGE